MGTIILAHGIFGFGDLLPGFPSLVNYFNGVEVHLGGFPKVFVPSRALTLDLTVDRPILEQV